MSASSGRHLLLTGGGGFVMSVLGRVWLEADAAARLTILDAAPLDAAARRWFAPVAQRLQFVEADVRRPERWRGALDDAVYTHVVHGATVTPISRGTQATARIEPEAQDPARIVDVNLMGTVALLEWARTQPALARFIYVSSGAVYRNHGPDRPGEPLPEDGYVAPRRLYGISKLAAEMVTERYGELFGIPVASVRPASVFGPMDRVTASRSFRHAPNLIAHRAVAGAGPIRVNTLDAVGDYIHAGDVAHAVLSLLRAPQLRYGAYNIGSGVATRLRELVRWAAERCPGFAAEVVPEGQAELLQDPTLRDGMWGAYDIARITSETGWRPRPVREGLHAYMDWLAAEPAEPAGGGST